MATKTIGFAVAEEDLSRLDRLADRFGNGNRSAFLREAMHQMEVVDRATRLMEFQAYGARRRAEAGLDDDDPVTVVRRVLKNRI
jgi:hypothetical protein